MKHLISTLNVLASGTNTEVDPHCGLDPEVPDSIPEATTSSD
jgi:hypothetical protein